MLVLMVLVTTLAPQANREEAIDLARNTLRQEVGDLPMRLLRAERVEGAELGVGCPEFSTETDIESLSGFRVVLVSERAVYDLRATSGIATLCRQNEDSSFREKRLERVPTGDEPSITGEVPDGLLVDIVDDLAEREGADIQAIETVRAEAVTWNDGSLGCAQPGMVYTQALVDGYHVELKSTGVFTTTARPVAVRSRYVERPQRKTSNRGERARARRPPLRMWSAVATSLRGPRSPSSRSRRRDFQRHNHRW